MPMKLGQSFSQYPIAEEEGTGLKAGRLMAT